MMGSGHVLAVALRGALGFRHLGSDALRRVAMSGSYARYGAEQVIGAPDEEQVVMLVVQGEIRIVLASEDGAELWLDRGGSGYIFEADEVLDARVAVSAVATVDGTAVWTICRQAMLTVFECNPDALKELEEHENQRVCTLRRALGEFAFYTPRLRLIHLLAERCQHNPNHFVAGSHEDLARWIRSDRQRVTQYLIDLRRRGLISYPRRDPHCGGLTVLDIDALATEGRKQG